MNWKIIVGGILIFAGIAQFIKLLTEYQHYNSLPMSIGLGILFTGGVLVGLYLVKQGRKES